MASLTNVTIPCNKCGHPIDAQLQPKPRIVNLEFVSIVVIDHSGQVTCPRCTSVVQPVVIGVGETGVVYGPVFSTEKQNLIVPPGQGMPTL